MVGYRARTRHPHRKFRVSDYLEGCALTFREQSASKDFEHVDNP